MKISYSRYELVPRSRSLNARDAQGGAREGALLKIETDSGFGFADLHPWTEFGDLRLEGQLKLLEAGRPTQIGLRSLSLAKIDLSFRQTKRSAFDGLQLPANHFLVPGPLAAGPDLLGALAEDGYRVVKIKCGRNPLAELQQFSHLVRYWPEDLRIRLDFNASLSFEAVDEYLIRLPRGIRERLEFAEDPCVFSVESWAQLRKKHLVGLALDLEATNLVRIQRAVESQCLTHIVIKPAVQNPDEVFSTARSAGAENLRFVMTSYLDHPLGQAAAAWTAGEFSKAHPGLLSECGLLSHTVYEPNEFAEEIQSSGPLFLKVDGTGFGFDDLLKSLRWQDL